MKKFLLTIICVLTGVSGIWARTALEYTALTTGVDYVLMDNGQQYFLANGGKTNNISAANRYQLVDAGDGKYYLMQTSTGEYVATASVDANATWTTDQASAEKFTIGQQNEATRVRFISSTNSSYFLNSQGNNTNCPMWRNGTGDWSYWIVYAYSDFFVPAANKGYKLKMKGTNLYVKFSISGYSETNSVNATILAAEGSIFKIASSGKGNTIKWQKEYMKTASSYGWNSGHGTDTGNSTWYIEPVSGEADAYYLKKSDAASGGIFFGNVNGNTEGTYLYTDQSSGNIKWILEETTMNECMVEQGYWPETSTSANPKYYTIKNTRCGKAAKYAGDSQKMEFTSDRLGSTANAFWFEAVNESGLADDVMAVKIHNVAAGKCVAATNSFTNDGITWYIKPDVYTGTTSVAINSNSTEWNNNSYGWNNESGQGNYISTWASTDIGSAWWIEALSTEDYTSLSKNYSSDVTSNIQPFVDNPGDGYFQINSANATSLSTMISVANGDAFVTHEEYKALLEQLNNNFMRYPEGNKFYRIKNNHTNNYLTYGQPSYNNAGLIATSSTDAGSVIRLEGSRGTYKLSVQGLNIQQQRTGNYAFPGNSNTGVDFMFNVATPGVVSITNADSRVDADKDGSLHEASDGWAIHGVVNWSASANASKWVIEDAETADIALTSANDNTNSAHTYATLCVPFEITALAGIDSKEVKAYAPTVSANSIDLGTGATSVDAGTPVILVGAKGATSVTATIGTAYAATPTEDNALRGTYTGTSINCKTNYVLGFDEDNNNRIGFYHINNTAFALKANRAYLPESAGGSNGFALVLDDDDLTAIASVINGQTLNGQYYDLTGRKVAAPQKGQIYIVNGKKVLY